MASVTPPSHIAACLAVHVCLSDGRAPTTKLSLIFQFMPVSHDAFFPLACIQITAKSRVDNRGFFIMPQLRCRLQERILLFKSLKVKIYETNEKQYISLVSPT